MTEHQGTVGRPSATECSALAEALFCSMLQPSQRLTTADVRAAVWACLGSGAEHLADCAGAVAQEAGDHPEACAARMRWCRQMVATAFSDQALAAPGTQRAA